MIGNEPMTDNIYSRQKYPDNIVSHEFEDESELGYFDALTAGLKMSPIGVSLRQTFGNDLEEDVRYSPKDTAEFNSLFEQVGYNLDALKRVTNNASSLEDVKANIELYKSDLQEGYRLSKNHWFTQLASGLLGMAGSPSSVLLAGVNPAFGASKLVRIGTNIASNTMLGVADNYINSRVTATEQDIESDVLGMVLMSSGLHGANFVSEGFAKSARKVALEHDKMKLGLPSDNKPSTKLARKFNKLLETTNDYIFSDMEVKERIYRDYRDIPEARELVDYLTTWQQGKRTDKGFETKLVEGETAFEIKNALAKADYGIEDLASTAWREIQIYDIPDHIYNQYLYQKVSGGSVEAIENVYPQIKEAKHIQELATKSKEHFGNKFQQLYNEEIITGKAMGDNYVPRVVNRYKMTDFIGGVLGGSVDKAKVYIKKHLKEGVMVNPERLRLFRELYDEEVLSKVKEGDIIKPKKPTEAISFNDWLDKKALDSAVGYLDQGRYADTNKGQQITSYEDNSVSFSFEKHRLPWDWNYRDTKGFSMLDVAEDFNTALVRYDRRTQGTIALKQVYETDFNGFVTKVKDASKLISEKDLKDNTRADQFEKDMVMFARRLHGMTLDPNRGRDAGRLEALSEVLRNCVFGAYSTYMGLLNYAEMTNAVKAYGAKTVINAIPLARELKEKWGRGEFSLEDFRALENIVTGGEVRALIGRKETSVRVKDTYKKVDRFTQAVVTGSRMFAQYSPGSLILRETQRSIVSTVQETFMGELIRKSHGITGKDRGFLRDIDVKRAGVTKEQLKELQDLLKANTRLLDKGKIDIKSLGYALENTPNALYTLRKLDEYVANETIQRRGVDDIFSWETQNNPMLSLATQFKTFALQSFNKRAVALGNRWEEEGTRELFSTLAVSTALSGMVNLGITGIRTLGMSEEDRASYIDRALGIEDFDITRPKDFLTAFLETGIYRNPYSASLMLPLNMVGIGTAFKTTGTTRGSEDDSSLFIGSPNLGNTVLDNLPALRFLQNMARGATGVANYSLDMMDIGDDFTKQQKLTTAKQLMSGLGTLPNIPILSNLMKEYSKEGLEDYTLDY